MARASKLMAAGMGVLAAKMIGGECDSSFTTAGSTSADAAKITKEITRLTTVGASSGAILPVSDPGDIYWLYNSSGTTATIYPPSGATINASASSLSLPTAKACAIVFDSGTHCFSVSLVPA